MKHSRGAKNIAPRRSDGFKNTQRAPLRSLSRRRHEVEGKLDVDSLDLFQTKDKIKLIAQLHDLENLVPLTEHFISFLDDQELKDQKQINVGLQKRIQELENDCSSMNTKISDDKNYIQNLICEYDTQINDFNNLVKQKDDAIKGLVKQVNDMIERRAEEKRDNQEIEKERDELKQTIQEEREETKITISALKKIIQDNKSSSKEEEGEEKGNGDNSNLDESDLRYISPNVIVEVASNNITPSKIPGTFNKQSLNITSLIEEIQNADQSHYEIIAGMQPAGQRGTMHHHNSIDIFEETVSLSLPIQSCNNETSNKIESHNENSKSKILHKEDNNLYLIGDSIAASIKNIIVEKCPTDTHIIDFSSGGATIGSVNRTFQMEVSNRDMAILIVGTNDLFRTKWDEIKTAFESMLNKLVGCKSVFVVQICRRYDTPGINKHITKLNTRIKHLVKTWNNVKIIHTKYIKYENISEDGIHLNVAGKKKLAHRIVTSLFPDIQSNRFSEKYRKSQETGRQNFSSKNDEHKNKNRKSNRYNNRRHKRDSSPSYSTKKKWRRGKRWDHHTVEDNESFNSESYWTQVNEPDPNTYNGHISQPTKVMTSVYDKHFNYPLNNEMIYYQYADQPPIAEPNNRTPFFQHPSNKWVHHQPTIQLPTNGWFYQQSMNQPPINEPVFRRPMNQPPINEQVYRQHMNQPPINEQVYRQPMNQPPINEPVYRQPMHQPPINESVYRQQMNQPPNNGQVYREPTNRPPIDESAYHRHVNQPPVKESIYRQPINQPPTNEPVYHQPMNQPPINGLVYRQQMNLPAERQPAPHTNQMPVNATSPGQNFLNMRDSQYSVFRQDMDPTVSNKEKGCGVLLAVSNEYTAHMLDDWNSQMTTSDIVSMSGFIIMDITISQQGGLDQTLCQLFAAPDEGGVVSKELCAILIHYTWEIINVDQEEQRS
ncbi:hypothetical protein WDU94_007608 [Cyamophila willieti]